MVDACEMHVVVCVLTAVSMHLARHWQYYGTHEGGRPLRARAELARPLRPPHLAHAVAMPCVCCALC